MNLQYSPQTSSGVVGVAVSKPSESALRREVDTLDKEIVELNVAVTELMGRLNPVLLAAAPANQPKQQAIANSAVCPLGSALFGFHQRVAEVRAMLIDIHQRLDI